MPLLAERRKKTKWTLNPGRRALWNNDDSSGIKFGQGLMEKLGWKVGQGLGINEQGMTEPLRISMKNDNTGIGFKDTESIEWVQQQHDFNELLEQLSSTKGGVENNGVNAGKPVKSVSSLEEKSKQSKTRVHYHKFTRGKDLSKYSKRDLECILGRKKEMFNGNFGNENCSEYCSKSETDQTIIYSGSMVDYFSKKMQKKKTAKECGSASAGQELKEWPSNDNEELGHSEIVKKKKTKEIESKKLCKESREINVNGCDDNIQESNCRNVQINAGNVEDCSQELKNEGDRGKDPIYDENVIKDISECNGIKKCKKKRKKEKEAEKEHVGQSDNDVMNCKVEKLDGIYEQCDEGTKQRRKDKKKQKGIETQNILYCGDRIVDDAVGKRKKTEDVKDHTEVVTKPRKEKRKTESKEVEYNSALESQLKYENQKLHRKVNEEIVGQHEEVSKPRKKEKKEKTMKAENVVVCASVVELEVPNRKREKREECAEHPEDASKKQNKKKLKQKLIMLENHLVFSKALPTEEEQYCETSRTNKGDCERSDVSKPRKKEKKKEYMEGVKRYSDNDSQFQNKGKPCKKSKLEGDIVGQTEDTENILYNACHVEHKEFTRRKSKKVDFNAEQPEDESRRTKKEKKKDETTENVSGYKSDLSAEGQYGKEKLKRNKEKRKEKVRDAETSLECDDNVESKDLKLTKMTEIEGGDEYFNVSRKKKKGKKEKEIKPENNSSCNHHVRNEKTKHCQGTGIGNDKYCEEISKPLKKEKRTGKDVEMENEEVSQRKRIKNCDDKHPVRVGNPRKKEKRKEKTKDERKYPDYGIHIQNEEDKLFKRTKIEENVEVIQALSKPRIREKRKEKTKEMDNCIYVASQFQNEDCISLKRTEMDEGADDRSRKVLIQDETQAIDDEGTDNECTNRQSKKRKRSKEDNNVEERVRGGPETIALNADEKVVAYNPKEKDTKMNDERPKDGNVRVKPHNNQSCRTINMANNNFSLAMKKEMNETMKLMDLKAFQGSNLMQVKGYGSVRT